VRPEYNIIDDEGKKRRCYLHAIKIVEIPGKGVVLNLWFVSVIFNPSETILYGPYLFGELDGKPVRDNRVEALTEDGDVKLELALARATGKRYQETPFARLGGAPTRRKVYVDG